MKIEYLKEILHYDPDSGVFIWKTRRGGTATAGSIAGALRPDGYIGISIDNRVYLAHVLAFFYMEGFWAEGQIDHIDRIRNNNRYNNLREASNICQMRNCKVRVDNSSGVKGVSQLANGKWHTKMSISGKIYHIGNHEDFDEVVCLRLAAEQCVGWHGCDSSSSAFLYVKENIQKGSVCLTL